MIQGLYENVDTVCLPSTKLFFSVFVFSALFDMLLKGMVESCLLSEDELLTPNIDEVMAVWIFKTVRVEEELQYKTDHDNVVKTIPQI